MRKKIIICFTLALFSINFLQASKGQYKKNPSHNLEVKADYINI